MVQGAWELIAMGLGVIGLLGTAAVTGMPMWKVTAFIGENIIVMETRWEGLWMNCYRQANIRMQCKVYDSLLYLPADLQAARGLMCSALALSGVGLLIALGGLRCLSCLPQSRLKNILLMVAGAMQLLASACVFIPVSWTGHIIIRDFYNPLLIDAQRHELGEALYVGWVTGAFLFASGLAFICRRHACSEQGTFELYYPGAKPTLTQFHPLSSTASSVGYQQPLIQQTSFIPPQPPPSLQSAALLPQPGYPLPPLIQYNPQFFPPAPLGYNGSVAMASLPSAHQSYQVTPTESPYQSHQSTASQGMMPYPSYNSNASYHPVSQNPLFVRYNYSRVESPSSTSSSGIRI